ncbi:DUF3157 family protein [Flavivirga rizhaonensis]|uniref:DUF3157 family protein n=1 Tax=Flavivirga rizhaonensis TaxID=2559571 RepID=A0A4V3P4B8_9FLAO|nr:DUF3157 family protein [Flavivirga rizhaonensis]TGV00714.1 DUF3157 family protein [Flavivirga rizhaonensis]
MKTFFFLLLFTVTCISFAQNNYIVKTEDGRRVLLKADFTWEYIDAEKPKPITDTSPANTSKPKENKGCNLVEDFTEPKLNKKIQTQLKRGRATIAHVKKKVAKDYNCKIADVLLISVSEQKEKAVYHFCANGTKTTYKRIGNSIIKKDKFF